MHVSLNFLSSCLLLTLIAIQSNNTCLASIGSVRDKAAMFSRGASDSGTGTASSTKPLGTGKKWTPPPRTDGTSVKPTTTTVAKPSFQAPTIPLPQSKPVPVAASASTIPQVAPLLKPLPTSTPPTTGFVPTKTTATPAQTGLGVKRQVLPSSVGIPSIEPINVSLGLKKALDPLYASTSKPEPSKEILPLALAPISSYNNKVSTSNAPRYTGKWYDASKDKRNSYLADRYYDSSSILDSAKLLKIVQGQAKENLAVFQVKENIPAGTIISLVNVPENFEGPKYDNPFSEIMKRHYITKSNIEDLVNENNVTELVRIAKDSKLSSEERSMAAIFLMGNDDSDSEKAHNVLTDGKKDKLEYIGEILLNYSNDNLTVLLGKFRGFRKHILSNFDLYPPEIARKALHLYFYNNYKSEFYNSTLSNARNKFFDAVLEGKYSFEYAKAYLPFVFSTYAQKETENAIKNLFTKALERKNFLLVEELAKYSEVDFRLFNHVFVKIAESCEDKEARCDEYEFLYNLGTVNDLRSRITLQVPDEIEACEYYHNKYVKRHGDKWIKKSKSGRRIEKGPFYTDYARGLVFNQ